MIFASELFLPGDTFCLFDLSEDGLGGADCMASGYDRCDSLEVVAYLLQDKLVPGSSRYGHLFVHLGAETRDERLKDCAQEVQNVDGSMHDLSLSDWVSLG